MLGNKEHLFHHHRVLLPREAEGRKGRLLPRPLRLRRVRSKEAGDQGAILVELEPAGIAHYSLEQNLFLLCNSVLGCFLEKNFNHPY